MRFSSIFLRDAVGCALFPSLPHSLSLSPSIRDIENIQEQIQELHARIESQTSDSRNLEQKIERKKGELERNKKRLKSYQSIRYVGWL